MELNVSASPSSDPNAEKRSGRYLSRKELETLARNHIKLLSEDK
jgi:hypothetical protein